MLEQAMKDLVNRMGVVHLGPALEVIDEKISKLKEFLKKPRSLVRLAFSLHAHAHSHPPT